MKNHLDEGPQYTSRDQIHRTNPTENNNNKYITSIALKSSGVRARKRNKTKSLIIFMNRGHIHESGTYRENQN